jgi:hypothetical protein
MVKKLLRKQKNTINRQEMTKSSTSDRNGKKEKCNRKKDKT